MIKSGNIFEVLANRIYHTPFNLWSSIIFLFAIIHTFFASKITALAKRLERNHKEKMRLEGKSEEEIDKYMQYGEGIYLLLDENVLTSDD